MKRLLLVLLCVCLVATLSSAQSKPVPWTPATYEGLKMGKATRADVERLYGKPDKTTPNGRTITLVYTGKGVFNGDVSVELDAKSGVIDSITLGPHPLLTRTTAYKHYGQDYHFVQYSKADCAKMRPESLFYRNPKGDIELIEYPSKGIILWPDNYGYDIASIVYRSKPLPDKKPACAK